jgi:hypothetical protein
MPPGNPRRAVPRRRYVYPPAIILTVLALVVIAVTAHAAGPRTLLGRTAQNTSFALEVHAGHVLALVTSLRANCGAGRTYQARWSPSEGHPVHFNSHGRSFSTYEIAQRSISADENGQIEALVHGRFMTPSTAQGTVRLTAHLYPQGRASAFCDSGDIPWSVTETK